MEETTANLIKEVGTKAFDLLEKLAVQLGTTVDQIYPYYVKQQMIEGTSGVGLVLLMYLITTGLLITSYKLFKGIQATNSDSEFYIPWAASGFILGTITTVVSGAGGQKILTQIFNPNYHAIQSIISDASKLIN